MDKRIRSIEDLHNLLEKDDRVDCYIALQGGARSSKVIWLDCVRDGVPVYEILNEIDDSTDFLTEPELWTLSNIGEAIDKGALFVY